MLRYVVALVCALAGAQAAAAESAHANGIFLVAKPGLQDPNFRETVVLVTQPAGGGPLGVIVNRPLGRRLSEFLGTPERMPPQSDELYFGGPVERLRLLALIRAKEPPRNSFHVLADVYLSTDPEVFDRLVNGRLPGAEFRIFSGYSGWAPGQLQHEMALGGWYAAPATAEAIFSSDPAALWLKLVKLLAARGA